MNFPTHIVTVGGLIENDEGKILMVKHPVRGWEIPGGQVEVGETITEALQREIKEETGIDIEVGNLTAVSSNIGIGVQYDGVSAIPSMINSQTLYKRQVLKEVTSGNLHSLCTKG